MLRSRFLWTAAVAVVTSLVAPAVSEAAFQIRISDGTNGATYEMEGTASNAPNAPTNVTGAGVNIQTYLVNPNPPLGSTMSYTVSFRVGNFTVESQVATTNAPGSTSLGFLTLRNTTVTNTGTSTSLASLSIELTSTPYNNPQPQDGYIMSSTFGANFDQFENATQSVQMTSAFANGTTLFDYSGAVQTRTVTAAQPQTSVITDQAIPGGSTPFTLTNRTVVNLVGGGTVSIANVRTDIRPAPAPAGLVMLAGALPFAGLLRLRRRVPSVTPATAA